MSLIAIDPLFTLTRKHKELQLRVQVLWARDIRTNAVVTEWRNCFRDTTLQLIAILVLKQSLLN